MRDLPDAVIDAGEGRLTVCVYFVICTINFSLLMVVFRASVYNIRLLDLSRNLRRLYEQQRRN